MIKDRVQDDRYEQSHHLILLPRSTNPILDPIGPDHPTKSDRIPGNGIELESDCRITDNFR